MARPEITGTKLSEPSHSPEKGTDLFSTARLHVSPIQEPEVRIPRPEDRRRVRAQPVLKDRAVVGPEVVFDSPIAVRVEVREVRRRSVNARPNGVADDEVGTGRSVVRPVRTIVLGAAPELGPRHQENVVRLAVGVEVVEERLDPVRDGREQRIVVDVLRRVVIEAAEGYVEDARSDVRVDDLRDQEKAGAERAGGVSAPDT